MTKVCSSNGSPATPLATRCRPAWLPLREYLVCLQHGPLKIGTGSLERCLYLRTCPIPSSALYEPQTRSNPGGGCRPEVACHADFVREAACHPDITRCFCNSGVSLGPPLSAADPTAQPGGRHVVGFWPLADAPQLVVTQSGHANRSYRCVLLEERT